jgi:hypothetical protein
MKGVTKTVRKKNDLKYTIKKIQKEIKKKQLNKEQE